MSQDDGAIGFGLGHLCGVHAGEVIQQGNSSIGSGQMPYTCSTSLNKLQFQAAALAFATYACNHKLVLVSQYGCSDACCRSTACAM